MATEVIMPKNGMAMEEGQLIRWLKSVGDFVEKDEPLIEIETDKITMEEPASVSGILLAKWAEEGQTIPVLETIGWIGQEGEAVPERKTSKAVANVEVEKHTGSSGELVSSSARSVEILEQIAPALTDVTSINLNDTPATPYAKKLAKEHNISLATVDKNSKLGVATSVEVLSRISATPLAERMATDIGISMRDVTGSGHAGKINSSDILSRKSQMLPPASMTSPMSTLRKSIARNMSKAHAEVPSVTQNMRADVSRLLELRKEINSNCEQKFTVNDFIVKAVSKALAKHPQLLVSLYGEDIVQHKEINIGVAVSLDNGLIVPVVKNADQLGIENISVQIKDLASRARSGQLGADEYSGSTFTVSNMGSMGVESFTPIINLPNAAILGVCAVVDELVMTCDGTLENRKKMMLSLTFDHRLLDGAPPAKFQAYLKSLLENPIDILL